MKDKKQFDLSGFEEVSPGVFRKKKTVLQPREKQAKVVHHPAKVEHNFEKICIAENPKAIVFKWADIHVSLNDWYSSEHWTKRNKTKQFWHKFFVDSLPTPYPFFRKYSVKLEFNSKLDPSNTITMIKLCEDTLQKIGIIENDNINNCTGLHIIPDLTMKKFTYKLTIYNEQ